MDRVIRVFTESLHVRYDKGTQSRVNGMLHSSGGAHHSMMYSLRAKTAQELCYGTDVLMVRID